MEFIQACKELIAIDSSPSGGTLKAAEFLKTLAESMGFQVKLIEDLQKGVSEANIICFPGEIKEQVHLMLQTHLDTVDPGSFAFWDKNGSNPFNASIHDGTIYGLGAADTKLDFLCKLFAAKDFVSQTGERDFAVVGTYGEEYNMGGAVRLIRHKSLLAEKALVSEPTHFNLVTAGKGLANIEITISFSKEEMEAKLEHDSGEGLSTQCKMFKGVAAHSSQPLSGENAIEKLIAYLEQLPDQLLIIEVDGGTNYNTIPVQGLIEFDLVNLNGITVNKKLTEIYRKILSLKKQFSSLTDDQFDPPMTTFNFGMIRTYSDHIKIMGCVRWPPVVTEDIYLGWMDDLKSFCTSLGAQFAVRDHKKPFIVELESDFVIACYQAIVEEHPSAQLVTQPVANEANVFHKLGFEALAFGPGQREGNSQTSHESIPIDNLHKATRIYKKLIAKLCGF